MYILGQSFLLPSLANYDVLEWIKMLIAFFANLKTTESRSLKAKKYLLLIITKIYILPGLQKVRLEYILGLKFKKI